MLYSFPTYKSILLLPLLISIEVISTIELTAQVARTPEPSAAVAYIVVSPPNMF